MSISYSITTKLDTPFSDQSIQMIIEKGFFLGFKSFKFIFGITDLSRSLTNVLEVQKALEETFNEDEIRCVIIEYQGAYFYMHFLYEESDLKVMFCGLSDIWSKIYADGKQALDVYKYAHIMLDLVADFKLLSMKIDLD